MGGPTIIEFSSLKTSNTRARRTTHSSPAHHFSNDVETPSPSNSRAQAVSKKNEDISEDHHDQGGFRRTVLMPAAAALVVFITMKQLATGPKLWNAAQLLTHSVQQKVQQIQLKYQPVPLTSDNSNTSFALAYKESYGFFDYITDSDWQFRQYWARTTKNHADSPQANADNPKTWYMNNYYPSFSCPNLMRVGRQPGPGPKWVCDPQRLPAVAQARGDNTTKCLIYSIGNPWKFDFEDGMLAINGEGCEIHVFFEGNMGAPKVNMNLHQWNIKSSTDTSGAGKTLLESMKELGHEGRVIDVLKVDCGNCEWTSYKDWLAVDTRQILFQTHNTPANANELFAALLEAGYVIYSREADMHPWHSRRHFLNVDWSVIKLDPKFSKAPPADGSGR